MFKKFDKTKKSNYLSLLTNTKYDSVSGVREHAFCSEQIMCDHFVYTRSILNTKNRN